MKPAIRVFIVVALAVSLRAGDDSPSAVKGDTDNPVLDSNGAFVYDYRVIRDRLHPENNPGNTDYSFLNGVGVVAPTDANGIMVHIEQMGTGFLVDPCHVLTNLHVVQPGDFSNPPTGQRVFFNVGQTENNEKGVLDGVERGGIFGAKFMLQGTVVAHGGGTKKNNLTQDPQNDWAVVLLDQSMDSSTPPLPIFAVPPEGFQSGQVLSVAGFPGDHAYLHGKDAQFKYLWGSQGKILAIYPQTIGGAFLESMIQTTPGNSGSPLYGKLNGRVFAFGMAQSIVGDGIHVSADKPNCQVLFTPATYAKIQAAIASSPFPRQLIDRLHPLRNCGGADEHYLNGVGAVMPLDESNHLVNDGGSGFLVDSCHVLTNLHVVQPGDDWSDPPTGQRVAFAVGQTEGDDLGEFRGAKWMIFGTVVAHGGATARSGLIQDPQNDWAVIRLDKNADSSTPPLPLYQIPYQNLKPGQTFTTDGFPEDHRNLLGENRQLKNLWEIQMYVVAVYPQRNGGAFFSTTIQATQDDSGCPVSGTSDGQYFACGMAAGRIANGAGRTGADNRNYEILFTPATYAKILAAIASSPGPQ